MNFLNPLFLTALAALAVPILLHLRRRRQGRTLDFPAVRYIRRTTQEQARIIRLRQLLLLALRMAAIVLLVLAGARMVLPLGGRDHPPAGLVLIVDNGISSGAALSDGRVLDTLVARAEEVLDRAGAQDRVWILPAGEPWRASVPTPSDGAREAVRALEPTQVTPDLRAQSLRASALLEASGLEIREIVVLSDFRPAALPEIDPETERRRETVHVAPPPSAVPSNRGVESIQISGGLSPIAGDPGELHIRVAGVNGAGTHGTVVRAYLEDRLIAAGRTGPDGTATLSFPPLLEGWTYGRVELDPDDLRGDDVGFFAFPVLPPARVNLGLEGSSFLSDAVATLEEAGRLQLVSPADADVQIISTALSVEPGPGSVVAIVPPDDPALLPATNRLLNELLPGWRLEPDGEVAGIERTIDGGIALSVIPERPAVRRAYRIEIADGASEATELLTLSDGHPWLVEGNGQGRTIRLLASPLDRQASDVPFSAAMIPLVDLLTSPRKADGLPGGTPAGHPLSVPPGVAFVRTPDGTLYPLDGSPSFSRTGHAGIYRFVADDGEVVELAAVNARPPEATPLTPPEIARRLAVGWEEVSEAAEWPTPILQSRRGREAWRWLLAALLAALLLEAWLAGSAPGKVRSFEASERRSVHPPRAHGIPGTSES